MIYLQIGTTSSCTGDFRRFNAPHLFINCVNITNTICACVEILKCKVHPVAGGSVLWQQWRSRMNENVQWRGSLAGRATSVCCCRPARNLPSNWTCYSRPRSLPRTNFLGSYFKSLVPQLPCDLLLISPRYIYLRNDTLSRKGLVGALYPEFFSRLFACDVDVSRAHRFAQSCGLIWREFAVSRFHFDDHDHGRSVEAEHYVCLGVGWNAVGVDPSPWREWFQSILVLYSLLRFLRGVALGFVFLDPLRVE